MNENKPKPQDAPNDGAPPPMDAFEREWTALLAEREPDLVRGEDAFVKDVLDRHEQAANRPAVIRRIGIGRAQLAAAAALVIAALVGWFVLSDAGEGSTESEDKFVEQPPATQPAEDTPVREGVDPSRLQLGRMIAQTRSTVTQPASNLTSTVRDTPQALRVERLLDLIETPVPDLKELLAPLTPDEQQSRA